MVCEMAALFVPAELSALLSVVGDSGLTNGRRLLLILALTVVGVGGMWFGLYRRGKEKTGKSGEKTGSRKK